MNTNPSNPIPKAKRLNPTILDEITVGSGKYSYRFYLTEQKSPAESGHNQQLAIEGEVRDKGRDWVRVRESEGYRAHTDHIVPLASILYFTETYRGEG